MIGQGSPKFEFLSNKLKNIRLLLMPLAWVYGISMALRNLLFDWNVFSSQRFSIQSIGVGNLSMGGTGKSVVVMYLIKFLKKRHRVATLSRGYGRTSRGVVVAGSEDDATTLGDEPNQFLESHPETVVVVSEKRVLGMKTIEQLRPAPQVVLMDDVLQHRWVRPHLMILTSSYDRPFFKDFVFPAGNLREFRRGVHRADLLLITRTPRDLSPKQKTRYLNQMAVNVPTFFTTIRYDNVLSQKNQTLELEALSKQGFVLVTGIADTRHLVAYLTKHYGAFEHLKYADHHAYSDSDVLKIEQQAREKIILTTEKDFSKLAQKLPGDRLWCLKIELDFVFEEERRQFERILSDI